MGGFALGLAWGVGVEVSPAGPSPAALGLGVGWGLLVAALCFVGHRGLGLWEPLVQDVREALGPVGPGGILVIAGFSSVFEELLFRGVLDPWWGAPASPR